MSIFFFNVLLPHSSRDIRNGYSFFFEFFFGFESTQLARQLQQERTQMEVQ